MQHARFRVHDDRSLRSMITNDDDDVKERSERERSDDDDVCVCFPFRTGRRCVRRERCSCIRKMKIRPCACTHSTSEHETFDDVKSCRNPKSLIRFLFLSKPLSSSHILSRRSKAH